MPDENRNPRYGRPEETEPLTASPEVLVSKYADPKFAPGDEQAAFTGDDSIDTGLAIAPLITDFRTAGLFNAGFLYGPPRPDEPISNENPLPFWRLVRGDTAFPGDADYYEGSDESHIQAYWVDSDESRSGKAIRFVVHAPPNGGTAVTSLYFSQTIPVSHNQQWGHFHTIISGGTVTGGTPADTSFFHSRAITHVPGESSPSVVWEWDLQDSDIVSLTGTYAVGFDTQSYDLGNFPIGPTERYVEYVFGMKGLDEEAGNPDTSYEFNVNSTYAKKPQFIWVTVPTLGKTGTATSTGPLYTGGEGDWSTAGLASHRYVADRGGVVLGNSGRVSSDITSGTVLAHPLQVNSNRTSGPEVGWDTSVPRNNYAKFTVGEWAFASDWGGGDYENIRAEYEATSHAPTGVEVFTHQQFMLFDRPDNSGVLQIPTGSTTSEQTVVADKDSSLLNFSGTNLGSGASNWLPVGYVSGAVWRSLVQFTITNPTNFVGVLKATLRLKTSDQEKLGFGSAPKIYVQRIEDAWSEGTVNDPPTTGNAVTYPGPSAANWLQATKSVTRSENTWVEIDVTDIVNKWMKGLQPNRGFRLQSVNESSGTYSTEFWSSDKSAANAPRLYIKSEVTT